MIVSLLDLYHLSTNVPFVGISTAFLRANSTGKMTRFCAKKDLQ